MLLLEYQGFFCCSVISFGVLFFSTFPFHLWCHSFEIYISLEVFKDVEAFWGDIFIYLVSFNYEYGFVSRKHSYCELEEGILWVRALHKV